MKLVESIAGDIMRSEFKSQTTRATRLKVTLAATSIALLLGGCASATHTQPEANNSAAAIANSADANYVTLANDIFEKLQAQSPRDSKQLPDMSPATLAERAAEQTQWLAQLQAVDVSALSRQNQINHRMLSYRLQNQVDGFTYKEHYMPL